MYNTLALNALNIILPFLNSLNRNWCMIGTTSLVLHGLENKSEDIDIVTDREGAKKLETLLANFKVAESSDILNDHMDSRISQYLIGGIRISILSDLKLKMANGWVKMLEIIRSKEIFDFNGYNVFIPSLTDQLHISRLFGGEKDLVQADKISTYLKA